MHRTKLLDKINENTWFQAYFKHPLIDSDRLKSVEKPKLNA
ncbi:MAG: hypothetical protein QNJ41_26985 [Xenococcaceae cyanobacterium MO_188.B32]|nr:hypothetical protein [Xenococcaceae cyanobacterium MO_188.B32]